MVGGFDDRVKISQDWDFAVQALRFVEPTFIPEPLLTYRIHARNTSRNAHETAKSEAEIIIDKMCEWLSEATPNSIAPTPRNWPHYFRVFAHLNKSIAGQTLAARLLTGCSARSPSTVFNRRRIEGYSRTDLRHTRPGIVPGRFLRRIDDSLPPEVESDSMSRHLFGSLSWSGYRLTIAVPERRWFDWLSDFTGLEVEPQETRTEAPVLLVIDDLHVLVDGRDPRTFESLDDLKSWLFLTVSDVMISRGEFTALHTAGIIAAGRAVLFSGPPWAGKSSWAFEAHRRGLEVLGDDQVRVDPQTGVVTGLPRPMKRRLSSEIEGHPHSPRGPGPARRRIDRPRTAPDDRPGPGRSRISGGPDHSPGPPSRPGRRGPGPRQIPGRPIDPRPDAPYSSRFLADAAASVRILGRLPNIRLSVGDGQIGPAMDIALDLT